MLKRASLALSHYPDACFRVCNCSRCLRMYHIVKCMKDLNLVQKSKQDYGRTPKELQSVLICQEGRFSKLTHASAKKMYDSRLLSSGTCDTLSHRLDQPLRSAFLEDLEKRLNQRILRKDLLDGEMSFKREIFCETASSAEGFGKEKCSKNQKKLMYALNTSSRKQPKLRRMLANLLQ
uniref:IP15262p n=1 Tax=Drosophila melanogaster TaxID=7227 RepID=B3LF66_DROME|nr:IP15262p [Drosophila melanogaster]